MLLMRKFISLKDSDSVRVFLMHDYITGSIQEYPVNMVC